MNKIAKVILKNILLAAAIVVLYSPGLLALRPTDPGILRAGFSIIGAIVIGYGFVKVNLLDQREVKKIGATERISIEDTKNILEALRNHSLFGKAALLAEKQLEKSDKYRSTLPSIINVKFPRGSLSFDKFNGAAMRSIDAVTENCRLIVLRIQMIEEKEYSQLQRLMETGAYRHDEIPDDVQEEKYKIFIKNKKNIESILAINEKLLLKLEALSIEISAMNIQEAEQENSSIVQEIDELIGETKYYT